VAFGAGDGLSGLRVNVAVPAAPPINLMPGAFSLPAWFVFTSIGWVEPQAMVDLRALARPTNPWPTA